MSLLALLILALSALASSRQVEAQGVNLTNAEVDDIIEAALAQAEEEDSLLRRDPDTGETLNTRMHIAVVDRNGRLLELHSMDDAWTGSIDIAIAKAYTSAAFSSNENALSTRSIGLLSQPGGPLWQIGNSNQSGGGNQGQAKATSSRVA